jgi:hypothetical protein
MTYRVFKHNQEYGPRKGLMMEKTLIASLVMLAGIANAAKIETVVASTTDRTNVILISGEIVNGDYDRFINSTRSINNNKPVTVLLEGPGGSLTEAIDIGLEINRKKYITVAWNGACASACAYIWLAGQRSIIDLDRNAKVGFHAPYYEDKFGNKKSSNVGSAILGGYLKELGAGYGVIAYATSVDGDSIRWLTETSAKDIGLTVEFFRRNNTKQESNDPAIEKAKAEITRTIGYNKTFNQQLSNLVNSGQGRSEQADYIRRSMATNTQYIKHQQDIIDRLQPR